MLQWEELEWQKYAEECKGMIVTNPGTVSSGAYTACVVSHPLLVWVIHTSSKNMECVLSPVTSCPLDNFSLNIQ